MDNSIIFNAIVSICVAIISGIFGLLQIHYSKRNRNESAIVLPPGVTIPRKRNPYSMLIIVIVIGAIVGYGIGNLLLSVLYTTSTTNLQRNLPLGTPVIVETAVYVLNDVPFAPSAEEQEVLAVVALEARAAIQLDLLTLRSIYSPNAVVTRRQGTRDQSDDLVYRGWEEIKENHYIGFKLGYEPTSIHFVDLVIRVAGQEATAIYKGIVINNQYSQYHEDLSIYEFEKVDDRWLITSLEFGNK